MNLFSDSNAAPPIRASNAEETRGMSFSAGTSGFDPDPDLFAALPAYQADSTPVSSSAVWPTIVGLPA
ncbi:hypothetical protein [Nocardia xishanensis]|uniref:Uncharacterized protein n=1 Tax=Nocardia xishanensis TaxID=238964 RepID=A0ABW7WTZ9_9NOCA